MEIKGKLISKLEIKQGSSPKGQWQKQGFIIETIDKYPKNVCLTAWNKAVDVLDTVSIGSDVTALFSIESKEYKGNWYTELKVYSISANGLKQQTEAIKDDSISDLPIESSSTNDTGLPF